MERSSVYGFRRVEHPALVPTRASLVAVHYDPWLDVADALRQVGDLPASLLQAVDKRKIAYLAGRYCAQQALRGLGVADKQVYRADDGSPVWPEGIIGSITHTDTYAAAVVGRREAVEAMGIDSERILNPDALKAVQSLVVQARERELIQSRTLPDEVSYALVFSAKESVFKALYPFAKQYFGFDSATVAAWHEDEKKLVLVLKKDLDRAYPNGRTFEIHYAIEANLVHTLLEVPNKCIQAK